MLAPHIPTDILVATLRNERRFGGTVLPNDEIERVQKAVLVSNERIILITFNTVVQLYNACTS